MSDNQESEGSESNCADASNHMNLKCVSCKTRVKKASFCPGCDKPYHPACMAKYPIISGVGVKKCCGAPSPNHLNPRNPDQPVMISIDQLRSVVREESDGMRESLARVERSISSLSDQISKQNDRLKKCESNITNVSSRLDVL